MINAEFGLSILFGTTTTTSRKEALRTAAREYANSEHGMDDFSTLFDGTDNLRVMEIMLKDMEEEDHTDRQILVEKMIQAALWDDTGRMMGLLETASTLIGSEVKTALASVISNLFWKNRLLRVQEVVLSDGRREKVVLCSSNGFRIHALTMRLWPESEETPEPAPTTLPADDDLVVGLRDTAETILPFPT